jgi:Conserved TM helix
MRHGRPPAASSDVSDHLPVTALPRSPSGKDSAVPSLTPHAVDIEEGVNDAVSTVATFVPKLVAFLLILVIGWFVAKLLAKVLDKILERVGFDRAVERGGIRQALANSKYDASDILAKIVFYTIMLFVLSTAFGVFGPNPISGYLAAVIAYLPKVFVAIVIIVIASAVAAGVKTLIQNSLGGLSYGRILANAASVLILALGVIAALDQLQIAQNVVNAVLYAALAALVGVVVVAVGGGGIRPMQARWETSLARYDVEKHNVRQQVAAAPSPTDQARHALDEAPARGSYSV